MDSLSFQNWLRMNSLTLNVSKTKYIAFSINSRGQPGKECTLKLHECQNNNLQCSCPIITKEESIKYLGVDIDKNLRWDVHINGIIKKLTKLTYFFKNLRNILTRKDITKVY